MGQLTTRYSAEPRRSSLLREYDAILNGQHWNIDPKKEFVIYSSQSPIWNAAKAIAISAYPQTQSLNNGGKAHKYCQALIAYLFRVSQRNGRIKKLPSWVGELKIERMIARLNTGSRNLMRSFVVRDLIAAALINSIQNNAANAREKVTFEIQFSPDLKNISFSFPVQNTKQGVALTGKIPNIQSDSLRGSIGKYRASLLEYAGPSPRVEGLDDEAFYQNTLNRLVRPNLRTGHIRQVVWKAATEYQQEAAERRLPIDQILMRKAMWAANLYQDAQHNEAWAIRNMVELGIAGCSCVLVKIGPPAPDS